MTASHWCVCRVLTLFTFLAHAASLATWPCVDRRHHSAALVVPAAQSASHSSRGTSDGPLLEPFLEWFHGHFDNYAQAASDRAAGLTPRLGGGHEHIHCHVQPLRLDIPTAPLDACALGTYYFDGNPQKIFRERLYRMREVQDDEQFGQCIQMSIYRLRKEVCAALRAAGGDAAKVKWSAADVCEQLLIPRCDVFWRRGSDSFQGSMRTESVVVDSETTGTQIIVRDDVFLWRDALWVNDRGTDMDGNYLYGNVKDVPYKMVRVLDSHWTACEHLEEPVDFESWLSEC